MDDATTPVNLGLTALASGAFAGLVAVLVTVVIERFGGVVGGLLGTLPTTIVPAAIGIAATATSGHAFEQALYAVPAGMLLNALYLAVWRFLPPRLPVTSFGLRLGLMVTVSLALWLGAAILVVRGLDGVDVNLFAAGAVAGATAAVGLLVTAVMPAHASAGKKRVTPAVLLARGVGAAVAVGIAVVIAARGGEAAAGVASVFPAIFLTTMVSLWLAHGESVSAGAVGPMMVGSTAVSAFALFASVLFPALGVAQGSVSSWLAAAVLVQLPLFFAVRTVAARAAART